MVKSNKTINSDLSVGASLLAEDQLRLLIVGVLVLLLVVASALGVIYSSYQSRQLFSSLQQLSKESMQLEEEWGRLLLEQSTWASHARIEQLAKSQLDMIVPDPASIVVIKQ